MDEARFYRSPNLFNCTRTPGTAIRKLLYGEMRHWLEANASTWQARSAGFLR